MKLSKPIAIGTALALSMTALHAPSYASAAEQGAFTASNGVTINYVKGSEGDNGAYVFLGGDGTTAQMTVGSRFTTNVSAVTDRHDVSGYFLLPPNKDHSWWQGKSFDTLDTWCVAVREFINSLDTETVEVMGYSGGAEFLGRHLLRTDTEWAPEEFSASMVGGGDVAGNTVTPPAPGKEETRLLWIVGEEDTYTYFYPTWSALETSKKSRTAYENAGFKDSKIRVLPETDHYEYDFPALVDERLNTMRSESSAGAAPSVDAGAPVPPPAAAPAPPQSAPRPQPTAAPAAPTAPAAPAAPEAPANPDHPSAKPKRPGTQAPSTSAERDLFLQLRRIIFRYVIGRYASTES